MISAISKTILLVFIINLADPTFADLHTDFDISSIDDSPGIRDNLHPKWFTDSFLNLKDDLKEAQAEGKLGIAIYFGQKDCAYCEKLLEINFSALRKNKWVKILNITNISIRTEDKDAPGTRL